MQSCFSAHYQPYGSLVTGDYSEGSLRNSEDSLRNAVHGKRYAEDGISHPRIGLFVLFASKSQRYHVAVHCHMVATCWQDATV